MIKAVVIDVDDTLCLTEAVCFEMENDVLQRMGRAPMPREIHLNTWGKPLFEVISERSPGIDVEEFKQAYHPVIVEYIAAGKLDTIPDENYAALDTLIADGKDIMLLTGRVHSELKHMLAPDHLLASRVKAFYYRDNMQYHKPDPRAFNDLLEQNGLRPAECVYVGDSLSDADAAIKAGLRFIASLEGGLRTREDFSGHKVDVFITRFPDIVAAIRGLA